MVTVVVTKASKKMEQLLVVNDQIGLAHYSHSNAKQDFLAGRFALMSCVKRIGKIYSGITYNHQGKPDLIDISEYYCNISHSNGLGVAAISKQPIGVDIEFCKPRSVSMMKFILTSKELRHFLNKLDSTSYHSITFAWTVKEAVLKASGHGLNYPLLSIGITDIRNSPQGWQTHVFDTYAKKDWIVDTSFKDEYYLSVAQPSENYIAYDIFYL